MRFTKVAVTVAVGLALGAGAATAQEADGKALYEANCVKCHGQDGTTPELLAKRFKTMRSLNDPAAYEGVSEDSTVALLENGVGVMKSYKGKLTHDEEVAIARYIRTLVPSGTTGTVLPPERAARPERTESGES